MPATPISHPLVLERLADAKRSGGGYGVNVLAAAIGIASQANPTLKPAHVHQDLETMARDARHLLAHDNPADAALRHVFAHRWGFFGDHEHYHDPRNSYIDCVLRRRMGLPILLAVVYVEMARRAGVTAHGIGLPGHFVAAVEVQPRETEYGLRRVYIDVYNQARELTAEQCRKAVSDQGVPWTDEYLEPLGGAAWTVRMLSNLRTSYLALHDWVNAAAVLEQMLLVEPGNVARQQELADLYERVERQRARDN